LWTFSTSIYSFIRWVTVKVTLYFPLPAGYILSWERKVFVLCCVVVAFVACIGSSASDPSYYLLSLTHNITPRMPAMLQSKNGWEKNPLKKHSFLSFLCVLHTPCIFFFTSPLSYTYSSYLLLIIIITLITLVYLLLFSFHLPQSSRTSFVLPHGGISQSQSLSLWQRSHRGQHRRSRTGLPSFYPRRSPPFQTQTPIGARTSPR